MIEINNFAEANEVLAEYAPPPLISGTVLLLDRMRELLSFLGNPQDNYKVVHVAGTSGKTSTSYYTAALLREAGCKVGLTVSPHIDEVNERVQINLVPLPEPVFTSELSKFLTLIEQSHVKPTYFELLVAFALWHFSNEKVDYAVLEVGLGGRTDATNIISRSDKVAVITDIGLDHTQILGDTLQKIAAEKAGIILPGNRVFAYRQGEEVMKAIREACVNAGAELHEIDPAKVGSEDINFLPLFQQRNWQLASDVYGYLAQRDGLKKLTVQQLHSSAETYIPGRMEVRRFGKKTLIMDGAHNPQKMLALLGSVNQIYPDQPMAAMVSFVQNKDIEAAMREVIGRADYVIITSFTKYQDMRRSSVDPQEIVDCCIRLGFKNYKIVPDPGDAYRALISRPEPLLLIAGSFFLLQHIRSVLSSGVVSEV